MNSTYNINFDLCKSYEPRNFEGLAQITGLYFIALRETRIPYPYRKSRLIYIGMSERKTNGIGSRLGEHYTGRSRNHGLSNYSKVEGLCFTYLNFEAVKNIWTNRVEDLESYLLLDFVENYGVYPICNNKSTYPESRIDTINMLSVSWDCFE